MRPPSFFTCSRCLGVPPSSRQVRTRGLLRTLNSCHVVPLVVHLLALRGRLCIAQALGLPACARDTASRSCLWAASRVQRTCLPVSLRPTAASSRGHHSHQQGWS